jgi:asparagine synthase (glutamine-hydrolysing)
MVRLMCHDPSWNSGVCDLDLLACSVGWTTDAGSFSDCMPAWNNERNVCLLFTGEEFDGCNELPGLKNREGQQIRPNAEALVHLYETSGSRFFAKLNGSYCGVLVDLRVQTVTLFNDRYGLNRLYYHQSGQGIHFASEAKSLLAVLPRLRRLDQSSLAEFYSVGCVLENRSLFADIALLPGGSVWTFHRDGRIERRRYFEPSEWEQQDPLEPETYSQRLAEVFRGILPRYLASDRPMALSLTGGLDSRMLLAWANAKRGTLPCYSFAGPYRDNEDVRIARILAEESGQTHTTIRIEDDFYRDFSRLAERTVWLSDGSMDVSAAVELYVNQRARAIAPIRLTGNYGSEILRSNVAFRPANLNLDFFTPEFQKLLRQAGEKYRREVVGNRLSFIAFKQVPWHHYARYSIERSQLQPRSPFLDNALVALAYRVPPTLSARAEPILDLIAKGNPALSKVRTDRLLQRGKPSFSNKLARAWQEFTIRAEYAYDYGMPQPLARFDRALEPLHLEKLFLGRHKFYHFRIWYRKQLSGHVRSLGCGSDPGCYVNGTSNRIISEHLSGRANHTPELHRLLSVQLIERYFLRTTWAMSS